MMEIFSGFIRALRPFPGRAERRAHRHDDPPKAPARLRLLFRPERDADRRLGRTWTPPDGPPELDWVREPTDRSSPWPTSRPAGTPRPAKLLAIGAQVRYSPKGAATLDDKRRRTRRPTPSTIPKTGKWSRWQVLEMPAGREVRLRPMRLRPMAGRARRHVLLPVYFGQSAGVAAFGHRRAVPVRRPEADATWNTATSLRSNVVRGLCEPSLVRFGGRYFLTIRNDVKGYVTASDDGLHFAPIKPWTFDDGGELGSYNTQQHWLAHARGLFLVYTRRGADNDHIFRHRRRCSSPGSIPRSSDVLRETERVLIPERGATLGNFGAAADRRKRVVGHRGRRRLERRRPPRGADGSMFVARVIWSQPNTLAARESRE